MSPRAKLAGRAAEPRGVAVRRARLPEEGVGLGAVSELCPCPPGAPREPGQGGSSPGSGMAPVPGHQVTPPAPDCLVLTELATAAFGLVTSTLERFPSHGPLPSPSAPLHPWPLEEVLTHEGWQRKWRGTAEALLLSPKVRETEICNLVCTSEPCLRGRSKSTVPLLLEHSTEDWLGGK